MDQTVNKTPVLPRHPANAANNDFVYMTLPLIAIAAYLYGARPVGLCAVALLTANLCDRLVAVMRRRFYDKTENSSFAFALIVTLLMPASVSYYVLIITVIITVVLGKAVFGGYGAYPFVPPALGFAAAALSWPDQVLHYPEPFAPLTLFGTEGVVLQQSASHTLAAGGLPNIGLFNLLLGNYPGSMGTTAGVVIIACAAYLWMRKRITLAAPLGFLGACVAIAYVFPRLGGIGLAWPWEFVRFRLLIVTYEILSGALLYIAVFLLNDETTLPKRQDARLIYGIVAGITAMVFRYYGSFDMGACFALLWVNVLSGPLDRWMSALAQRRKGNRVTVRAGWQPEKKAAEIADTAPALPERKPVEQQKKKKNAGAAGEKKVEP